MIPFLDLHAHHAPRKAELMRAIEAVVDSGQFAGGPFVTRFELAFAKASGAREAVGVANGTDALMLSLWACGVGTGDEVITVPNSFFASAEAISLCGARPVFVDVLEDTATMDPSALERAITPATRAIIPVHLWGQTADMEPILAIARFHRLRVIEDACQAHGALYQGKPAGTLGDLGCFSFYPGKNLGAFGEAGAVITDNPDLAARVRILRDHGQTRKYHHGVVGINGRMDGIQAAVLEIKLRDLDQMNANRRRCAALYDERLADIPGLTLPTEQPGRHHVYHIYSVLVKERDHVLAEMGRQGVGCGIHYPVPIHLQPAYRGLGYLPGAFPVAERLTAHCLSLPIFPELTPPQIETVCRTLKGLLQSSACEIQADAVAS